MIHFPWTQAVPSDLQFILLGGWVRLSRVQGEDILVPVVRVGLGLVDVVREPPILCWEVGPWKMSATLICAHTYKVKFSRETHASTCTDSVFSPPFPLPYFKRWMSGILTRGLPVAVPSDVHFVSCSITGKPGHSTLFFWYRDQAFIVSHIIFFKKFLNYITGAHQITSPKSTMAVNAR